MSERSDDCRQCGRKDHATDDCPFVWMDGNEQLEFMPKPSTAEPKGEVPEKKRKECNRLDSEPSAREWTLTYNSNYDADFPLVTNGPFVEPEEQEVNVIEYAAWEKRDDEAKFFCRLYNEALDKIIKLEKECGREPGDY